MKKLLELAVITGILFILLLAFFHTLAGNTVHAFSPQELHTIRKGIKYSTEIPIITTDGFSSILYDGKGYAEGVYLTRFKRIYVNESLSPFNLQRLIAHEVSHYVWYEKLNQNQRRLFCRNTKKNTNATWYISYTNKEDFACAERYAEMRALRLYGEWSFLPNSQFFNLLNK